MRSSPLLRSGCSNLPQRLFTQWKASFDYLDFETMSVFLETCLNSTIHSLYIWSDNSMEYRIFTISRTFSKSTHLQTAIDWHNVRKRFVTLQGRASHIRICARRLCLSHVVAPPSCINAPPVPPIRIPCCLYHGVVSPSPFATVWLPLCLLHLVKSPIYQSLSFFPNVVLSHLHWFAFLLSVPLCRPLIYAIFLIIVLRNW